MNIAIWRPLKAKKNYRIGSNCFYKIASVYVASIWLSEGMILAVILALSSTSEVKLYPCNYRHIGN